MKNIKKVRKTLKRRKNKNARKTNRKKIEKQVERLKEEVLLLTKNGKKKKNSIEKILQMKFLI